MNIEVLKELWPSADAVTRGNAILQVQKETNMSNREVAKAIGHSEAAIRFAKNTTILPKEDQDGIRSGKSPKKALARARRERQNDQTKRGMASKKWRYDRARGAARAILKWFAAEGFYEPYVTQMLDEAILQSHFILSPFGDSSRGDGRARYWSGDVESAIKNCRPVEPCPEHGIEKFNWYTAWLLGWTRALLVDFNLRILAYKIALETLKKRGKL